MPLRCARATAASAGLWLALGAATAGAQSGYGHNEAGAILVDGVPQMFVAGENGTVSGDTLLLHHNSGFSLMRSPDLQFGADNYEKLSLLGRSISFEVDLSSVGCGCNLAFYLIGSPALGDDGSPSKGNDREGQPPYYCDANKVGGQWCPEVDIMEANTHAFQATAHSCSSPEHGHYEDCDRNGLAEKSRTRKNAYGPGSEYLINTRKPFSVVAEFPQDAVGRLAAMRTKLQQSGNEVVLEPEGWRSQVYLSKLTDILKSGMSLRMTYWGGDYRTMAWMDDGPCSNQNCSKENAGDAVIRNIAVSTQALPNVEDLPPPPPEMEEAFGDDEDTGAAWEAALASDGGSGAANSGVEVETFSTWEPTPWASWQCHVYESAEQQSSNFCQTAGIKDGWEFNYNGGKNSPCGDCWCCKRQASKVTHTRILTTTAAPTTSTTTPAKIAGVLGSWGGEQPAQEKKPSVWVVSGHSDPLLGQKVPDWVIEDPMRFTRLKDYAIARWGGESHFAREVPAKLFSEDGPWAAAGGPPSLSNLIMKKFDLSEGSAPIRWSGTVSAVAVSALVVVSLATLCAAVSYPLRRWRARASQQRRPSSVRILVDEVQQEQLLLRTVEFVV